jgi:hypothetical protein
MDEQADNGRWAAVRVTKPLELAAGHWHWSLMKIYRNLPELPPYCSVEYPNILRTQTILRGEFMVRLPAADLRDFYAQTKISVLPQDYVVVYLPLETKQLSSEWFQPSTTRFLVVIREADRFVLVLPKGKWLQMQSIFENEYEVDGPLKVIDLAIEAGKAMPGYLTHIGAIMTQERIRTFPISSFRRNHLMVSKADLPRTVKVLREFFDRCNPKTGIY